MLPRSAAGGPSRTEQPGHTLCRSGPIHRSGRVSGRRLPAGTDSAARRRSPWKGGVHNRFAGRPEPMAWRPSGETCFMAWTLNRSRRRESDRRHRPGLEHLDDRCLLSTGAGAILPHHAVPGQHSPPITPAPHTRLTVRVHGLARSMANATAGPATAVSSQAATSCKAGRTAGRIGARERPLPSTRSSGPRRLARPTV